MLLIKNDYTRSIIFTILYLLPFPLSTFTSGNFRDYGFFLLFFFNIILMSVDLSWKKKQNISYILFALMFIILGLFSYLYKHTAPQNFLFPFMAIYATHYLTKFNFKFVTFDILLLFLYVFYYNVYYSQLSNLFFHSPSFDDNLFVNSSSNSIPICLNLLLYIYLVLVFYFNKGKKYFIKLLVYSLINIVLIIIQQSRAGIIISLLLFIIIYFQFLKSYQTLSKLKYLPLYFLSVVIILFSIKYSKDINNYLRFVGGNEAVLTTYKEDPRGDASKAFFERMDFERIIFGYPEGHTFGETGLKYTYNTFLDVWNNYTIIGFIVLSLITIRRLFKYKEYFFPVYFLLPFLIYSFVEPRFLPNYWDFAIYLLLFKKNI